MEKKRKMSIGHQLFEFLQYWTDTGSYCFQNTDYFMDAEGYRHIIKEMYINYEEKQVYLILEDENQTPFHVSIHGFIRMMGGANHESYVPLYHLRDEINIIKKLQCKKVYRTLSNHGKENKGIVKKLFKNLKSDEGD